MDELPPLPPDLQQRLESGLPPELAAKAVLEARRQRAGLPKPKMLRTRDEIWIQAAIDGLSDPPLTQEQADQVAAILAPYWRQLAERGRDGNG